MKLVILDFDGVLMLDGSTYPRLDCVLALNRITDTTGARILVSSSWRSSTYPKAELLRQWGVTGEFIDETPFLMDAEGQPRYDVPRGDEINEWFLLNGVPESFVILDDDSDMGDLFMYLVQTDAEQGLTGEDANAAIVQLSVPASYKVRQHIAPGIKPVEEQPDYLQPLPFRPGPYKVLNNAIMAGDGGQIGNVDRSSFAPAHAALFAASWDLFGNLVSYVQTDVCTDHAEGETCRFCASLNSIRRALNEPDEPVPVLNYFRLYKEQERLKDDYKTLYEAQRKRLEAVSAKVEERIIEIVARQDRYRSGFPEKARALSHAVAELSLVQNLIAAK